MYGALVKCVCILGWVKIGRNGDDMPGDARAVKDSPPPPKEYIFNMRHGVHLKSINCTNVLGGVKGVRRAFTPINANLKNLRQLRACI